MSLFRNVLRFTKHNLDLMEIFIEQGNEKLEKRIKELSETESNKATEQAKPIYRDTILSKAEFEQIKKRNRLLAKLAKKEITQEDFNKALETIKKDLS